MRDHREARRVELGAGETVDVLGPTVEFLTPLDGVDDAPCVMRGTIPPGFGVPLHSHADPETFHLVAGSMEGLSYAGGEPRWIRLAAGDVFHVPGDARHAWRNLSPEPAVSILVGTVRLGRFFREIGTPVGAAPGAPAEETLARFLAVAERYGYWNATPEENAEVGVPLLTP